ncbi:MAG: FG-GAP-like repeat-containing protein, partial [Cyanobacteria bacterium]|nr:FG-GAP-like repeat-containing protein [Cyanobacteriota bacterium]
MSTTSRLQLVNDGNGTAHAFVIDEGAIWRCQWNAQAQRWDRAELLPEVSGASELQALVVPNLWPTDSDGRSGSKPGFVLAYRVGLGSSAPIYGSLAQWNSQGQLVWSAPIRLSTDQADNQSFSLVPSSTGFSLVLQNQPAGSQSADKPAADSDLYAIPFAIQDPAQPQLIDVSSGASLGALSPAVLATAKPTVPAPSSLQTRQELLGSPAAGIAAGSSLTRWSLSGSSTAAANSNTSVALPGWPASGLGAGLAAPAPLPGQPTYLQGMARTGADLLNAWPGASPEPFGSGGTASGQSANIASSWSSPVWLAGAGSPAYRGVFGLSAPAGAGVGAFSSAKLAASGASPQSTFGGQLRTLYGYGLTSSYPGQLSRPLLSVTTSQSAGLDSNPSAFGYLGSGTSVQLDAVYAAGWSWQQSLTSTGGGVLPDWLNPLAGSGLPVAPQAGSVSLAQQNAFAGTALAALGPASWIALTQAGYTLPEAVAFAQGSAANQSVSSTADAIWNGSFGLQARAATEISSLQTNGVAGPFSTQVGAQVDARLPLGGLIPLLQYSHKLSDPGTSAAAGFSSSGSYTAAADGAAYPFVYAPEAGSTSLLSSVSSSSAGNPVLLGGAATPLQLFSLAPTAIGAINAGATGTGNALTLYNAGSGLNDGVYTQVPILGVTVDGSQASGALASFNVVGGSIDPSSFQISAAGSYLDLPLFGGSGPQNNDYALVLDVYSTGIVPTSTASSSASSSANPYAGLPLVTVNSSLSDSPLQIQAIERVVEVPVSPAAQAAAVRYPLYNPATPTVTTAAPSNDNSPYAYRGVAVQLQAGGAAVSLLNPDPTVTATVLLSGGVIQQVLLDQPLLFVPVNGASSYSLSLTLPQAVLASLPAGSENPVYTVDSQALGFNNLVADEQFSAQQGQLGAGVYLAAGMSDGLTLTAAMGGAAVQNRVAYVSTSDSGGAAVSSVVYLNGSTTTSAGSEAPQGSVSPDQLTPAALYSDANTIVFSAASSPTAITLAGDGANGSATFVAWVEAGGPVIPITTPGDGSSNVQDYLQALYGNQRINFRILQDGTWAVPALADLYTPANPAVIHDLKAVNVANATAPGGIATLVVWSETSIAALQGAIANDGNQQTNTIPTVIKAGWINPNAQPISSSGAWDWNSLFSDAQGRSSIQTIPWDPSVDVGLAINDLSIASQPMPLADGSLSQSPLLSWSQAALPSYSESVLNDAPILYLQFNRLQSGLNDINLGSVDSIATATSASSRGLNYAIAGAIPDSNATAVQNSDGTGLISTGLGTMLRSIRAIAADIPPDSSPTNGTSSDPGVSRFSGSITNDILTVTGLSLFDPSSFFSIGSMAVGDVISGPGITPGTSIVSINSYDGAAGTGTFTLNTAYSNALPVASLSVTPVSTTLPYSIEFWAQLPQGSNPKGAGLVSLGQPSSTAVGAAILPDGWLLNSSFLVDQITYEQAAARGLITSPGIDDPKAIYGWQWAVQASGANTEAMVGNGGSNVYSNALLLNNLASGAALEGVNQFLANYKLTAADLVGVDGLNAATIARAPSTELQFGTSVAAIGAQPDSALKAIAIDPSTAVLNQGLVLLSDLQDSSATNSSLIGMFETLWDYQRSTGEAKVHFDLSPDGSSEGTPTPTKAENYAGYELGFSLVNGIAVSVNGSGQLVYDLGQGTSLVSQAIGTAVPADLRDDSWHHIVATYLPTYVSTDNGGVVSQSPSNSGVASLYVDNQLVAQQSGVANVPLLLNLNDQAQLLTNNVGGAIDQLAFYNKALTSTSFSPDTSGQWPVPTSTEALALLAAMGYSIAGQSPDPGTIPGAISQHYAARNVDPKASPLTSYTSAFNADTGTWSEASPLTPLAQPLPTSPSFRRNGTPAQDGLVINVPISSWTSDDWLQTTASGSSNNQFFDPSNQLLSGVTVTLVNISRSSETPLTLQLSADQVLLGDQSLQSLQPLATASSFLYRVPTNTPALTLLIPADQLPAGSDSLGTQSLSDRYAASVTFDFATYQGSLQGTIAGTKLTVSSLNGTLAVGDLISGPGILPGTSITAVLTAFKSSSGKGIYTVSQSQTLSSTTTLTILGDVTTLSPSQGSLQGAITGTVLTVTSLNGNLEVGDLLSGTGVAPGTFITGIRTPFSAATNGGGEGSGIYSVSQNQVLGSTALTILSGVLDEGASLPPADSQPGAWGSTAGSSNSAAVIGTALVVGDTPLTLQGLDNGLVLRSASNAEAANNPALTEPLRSFGQSQVVGQFNDSAGNSYGWLAIAQPFASEGLKPAPGQVFVQYTGQSANGVPSSTAAQAPSTWLKALASSRFEADRPNLPLRDDVSNPSSSGGLLIRAEASAGWGQGFGDTMLVADVNNDGVKDLVISAPQANGGGKVLIINGLWIQKQLTTSAGTKILDLSDPDSLAGYVTVLTPSAASGSGDDISAAAFGSALAFDNVSKTLWIGAPNYQRQLNPGNSTPQSSLQPIGAVYSYTYAASNPGGWDQNLATPLACAAVGSGGVTISTDAAGAAISTYWGSRFGSAIAVNDINVDGSSGIAVSAPGVQASLLYGGSEAVQQELGTGNTPTSPANAGALEKIQLPGVISFALQGSISEKIMQLSGEASSINQVQVGDLVTGVGVAAGTTITGIDSSTYIDGTIKRYYGVSQPNTVGETILTIVPNPIPSVSTLQGSSNPQLLPVASGASQAAATSPTMQNLKALQVDTIVPATQRNNQAIQSAAVGAVYLFNSSGDLQLQGQQGGNPISDQAVNQAVYGGASFYGPNPWNTLGDTGFGTSLSFADLTNRNSNSILSIGAPQTGGSGALYLVDTSQAFTAAPGSQPSAISNINLGSNQYLAYLASGVTLYGAASGDNFANGLVSLGDVNEDGYGDLLVQGFNAANGAGVGYVLFGNDQLLSTSTPSGIAAASGSVAPGSIGSLQRADGTTINGAILSLLGSGQPGYTGQGTCGAGDVNGDAIPDIPLGSGPNGSASVSWGGSDLAANANLQLSRMASDSGMVIDDQASTLPGSLQSIGDFNGDGIGDVISILPGDVLTSVRLYFGQNSQATLPSTPYRYYNFNVANGTQVLAAGDMNGDGYRDLALFLDQNLSASDQTNQNAGAGSTTGIFYGRPNDQLPASPGFGLLAPVGPGFDTAALKLPGLTIASGLTSAAASVIAVGTTLYAAVQGVGAGDTTIWFSQSSDGGNSWADWTDLSNSYAGFATTASPSLAFFDDRLYLGFVDSSGALSVASWDPDSASPADWSSPNTIASPDSIYSSGATYDSRYSPQLVNGGDSLDVVWVDSETGQVCSASSTTPTATVPWSPIGVGSSVAAPALARLGNTLYMAVQSGAGGNAIYWTSSTDDGVSWVPWTALPSGITSVLPPSLAVVGNTLYLSYLGDGNNEINIVSLDASSNTWNTPYQIPGQTAAYASLSCELVGGEEQLAVYYVSYDSTNRILKAYTSTPSSSSNWTSDQQIYYDYDASDTSSGVQTASGPIAVSQYGGLTYLAYQGGTTSSASDEIYLATSSSSNLNIGSGWTAQALLDPDTRTGLGLSSDLDGLWLTYGNSSQSNELQVSLLTPDSSGTVTVQTPTSLNLPVGLSNNVSTLDAVGSGQGLILAGINDSANSNTVKTSLVDLGAVASWTAPNKLQQGSSPTTAISATAAPSVTWLGGIPVLAVNNNGTIVVYAGNGANNTLNQISSFTASDGVTSSSEPVLTSTDTGLALSYNNSSGSVTLYRTDLIRVDGSPVAGVKLGSFGVIDTINGDLGWDLTTLSQISTAVGSVPLNVDGTLMLVNVRNDNSQANEIWINAVPNRADADSLTWLNSTVQLPGANSGDWTVSQQIGTTINLGTTVANWQDLSADKAVAPPAFAWDTANDVIYAASLDSSNTLWWSSSSDGGKTWATSQELPTTMTTELAPALGIIGSTLYLAYVGTNKQINITSMSLSEPNNTWASVYQLNQYAQSISMVYEWDKKKGKSVLGIYYLGTDDKIYRTYNTSTSPSQNNDWDASMVIPNQTASGQIVATRLGSASDDTGTTYFAYQGGTPSSPSDTIYLSGSTDPGSGSSWWVTDNIPQSTSPSHSGVGLTTNSQGLILSFADVSSASLPVLNLQQATVTSTTTTWAPYTTIQSPSLTPTPAASVFATPLSSTVLVAGINTGNSWTGVNGGSSPATPSLARQSITVALSDTTNYALGTGANAGQVLLTAAGQARIQNGTALPAFTLTPISGKTYTAQLQIAPAVIKTAIATLPSLTITPATLTSAATTGTAVAVYSTSASTISSNGGTISTPVSVSLSQTTAYEKGTTTTASGKTEYQVQLTAAGAALVSSGATLPSFTLTPSAPTTQDGKSVTVDGTPVTFTPAVTTDSQQPTLTINALNILTQASTTTPPPVGTVVATFDITDPGEQTVYMAVLGNNNDQEGGGGDYLYWTSSANNGNSWNSWKQLPSTMNSAVAPSVTVLGGTLYLGYLGTGNNEINITSLDSSTGNWSTPYQIPISGQSGTFATASYLSLCTESDQGTQQLAIYYVDSGTTGNILKAYTSDAASNSGWTVGDAIQYTSSGNLQNQTASGPITVSQYNDQTYLAYQGGTPNSPATQIYLASSANPFVGSSWAIQQLIDPGTKTALGLSGNDTGLTLSYGKSSLPNQLQLQQYEATTTPWSNLGITPSSATALVFDGSNTVYSAVISNGAIQWAYGTKNSSGSDISWSDWQVVGSTSLQPAAGTALASNGTNFYMAFQAGEALYWTSSSDSGASWNGWQVVVGATPGAQG